MALAVSPHLDDAAFSCGGTLATLAATGWHVVVATVFTASVLDPQGFALACQLDKGLSPETDYMALRRTEDQDAALRLRAEPRWLPFPEAPHRGYGSAAALFGGVHPDDDVDGPVTETLASLFAELEPELILGPQAIGGHVDHIQVVRALTRVLGSRSVLWWMDFPYTVRSDTPQRPFAEAMASLVDASITLSPDAQARKKTACAAYRSQLGFQFGGQDGLDRRLDQAGGIETFRSVGGLNGAPFQVDQGHRGRMGPCGQHGVDEA